MGSLSMSFRRAVAGLVMGLTLAAPGWVSAATIRWDFAGSLSEVSDPASVLFSAGDAISGYLIFDTADLIDTNSNPNISSAMVSAFAGSHIKIGGTDIPLTGARLGVHNNVQQLVNFQDFLGYDFFPVAGFELNGLPMAIGGSMWGPESTVHGDGILAALNQKDMLQSYFFSIRESQTANNFNALGALRTISVREVTVTSPIPEPSTWALLIAGFALTGGALRAGRRAAWSQARQPLSSRTCSVQ